jgi:hypothetical protein
LFTGTSDQVNEDSEIIAHDQVNDAPFWDGRGGGGQTLINVVEIGGGNMLCITLVYWNEKSILSK